MKTSRRRWLRRVIVTDHAMHAGQFRGQGFSALVRSWEGSRFALSGIAGKYTCCDEIFAVFAMDLPMKMRVILRYSLVKPNFGSRVY